jgi:alpha-amylase
MAWKFLRFPTIMILLPLAACTAPTSISTPAIEVVETTTSSFTTTPTGEPGWWNDAIFYEIFVRSFKDSDGDGIGDFKGIIEKLDYLNDGNPETTQDLGITAIWLMPVTESPSYHGYDVVDYYAVDQEYGTREDFLHLVDEAHARGIRVIVDLVLNHTGRDHPWFAASDAGDPAYRDWYIWSETNPGYLGPWGQRVWYEGSEGYFYAIFWSGMPDLNLENPAVTQEIYDITTFWLSEMKVDGFRLDAIRHYIELGAAQENTPDTHTWLQDYHDYYKSVDPTAFTVGEAWTTTKQVVDYIGDEVDIAFEFDLAKSFLVAASGPIVTTLTKQLQITLDSYPAGQYGVFLANHDQDRVMSALRGDTQRAKLAAVMMLTAPGVPFIYYGEEIGMTGVKPDEDIRRPMQWTGETPTAGFTSGTPWRGVADDLLISNVAVETEDTESLLSTYRDLIHLRNEHEALRTGETLILDADTHRLFAVLRYTEEEAFLVLVNVHPTPLTDALYQLSTEEWPLPSSFSVSSVLGLPDPTSPIIVDGKLSGYIPFSQIPAMSYAILRFGP